MEPKEEPPARPSQNQTSQSQTSQSQTQRGGAASQGPARDELRPGLRALLAADRQFARLRRGLRRGLGLAGDLRVVPYRGFGTPRRVVIRGRVQEDRGETRLAATGRRWDQLRSAYLRYATEEAPHAKVELCWGGRRFDLETDEEGFLHHEITPPATRPGWNEISLRVGATPPVPAHVWVQHAGARFGVISDIDDTIIAAGMTSLWRRFRALFLTPAEDRPALPGVDALYRGWAHGETGSDDNPILFVSSSPYNLHEHLERFFDHHDVVSGPLMLRDWGISKHGLAPGGGHGHKLRRIDEVLDLLPELSFVLVGDSGQEDATHYLEAVRRYPGRFLAVYIRLVRPRHARRLAALAEEFESHGVAFLAASSSEEIAAHSAQIGLMPAGVCASRHGVDERPSDAAAVLDRASTKVVG